MAGLGETLAARRVVHRVRVPRRRMRRPGPARLRRKRPVRPRPHRLPRLQRERVRHRSARTAVPLRDLRPKRVVLPAEADPRRPLHYDRHRQRRQRPRVCHP